MHVYKRQSAAPAQPSAKIEKSAIERIVLYFMTFESRVLGRTGVSVGRLGVSASYGVPAAAVERAFEHGVNYFYWGSFRRDAFAQALRNLASQRGRWVLVIQSYVPVAAWIGPSVERGLRKGGFEYADVLLLGLWNRPVGERVLDACRRLRERGLVRYLAVSSHQRPLVARFAGESDFDILHFRYNAVHTGAEQDIFPKLPQQNVPGMVAYTATNWGQLMQSRRTPKGEQTPRASDCYRFVMARPEVDVCMTGPSNAAHMDEALEALHRGPMGDDELAWMRRAGKAIYGK